MISSFAWNDSVLCWLYLGEALLCALYSRLIEERITFSFFISKTFLFLTGCSVTVVLFTLDYESLYGPIIPTMIFMLYWFTVAARTIYRFSPRICSRCGKGMCVSVFNSKALSLYGSARVHEDDVWFCTACKKIRRELRDCLFECRCTKCNKVTDHSRSFLFITPPSASEVGVSTERSVCTECGLVRRKRKVIRPILRGTLEEVIRTEQAVLRKMNRLYLVDS